MMVQAKTLRDYAKSLVEHSDSGVLLDVFSRLTTAKRYIYGDEYLEHPVLAHIDKNDACYVPDAGHFVMEDQPRLCAQFLRNSLPQ